MVMVPQVQMPDFAGTLMRGEQFQQSRLQALATRQALDDAARFDSTLAEIAPALAAGDGPGYDGALARLVGAGRQGFTMALPMLQERRGQRALQEWQGGGQTAPAAPAGAGLQRIAAIESGGNDNARNPGSSAAGRFQIIDSTWNQYAPRLGLTPAQRMDPAAQERVAAAIQADARQAVGRDLSPAEQYGAHFLGIGGLRAFLSADPNADAQTVYAQAAGPQIAAQAFQRNPGLLQPGMTVGQVMANLERRMGGGAPAADTIPTQNAAPGGSPAPSRTGIDPAELRRIEQGLASPFPQVRQAAQARLQTLQMQQRDPTDSFRDETRDIGGRRVAGQVNLRTGQFTPYGGQTDRPEGITDAQARATVRRLGPQIAQGAISPTSPEYDDYAIAYEVATRATPVWVDDPNNPGTQRQQMQPGLVLDPARFPRPGGSGNGPAVGPTPAGPMTSPASATVPASGGNDASPVAPDPRTRTDPAIQPTSGDRTRLRALEVEAQGVLDAFQAFREARNSAGLVERGFTAAGIPTPLATAWTNAALLAKGEALFNLGVLNGPDLQIIQRAISDPSTMRGFFTGNATAEAQIQQIENLIRSRLESARRQYGAPLPPAPQGQTAGPGNRGSAEPPPPAPRRTAPALGTVEDGFRFRGGDPSSPSNWERVR